MKTFIIVAQKTLSIEYVMSIGLLKDVRQCQNVLFVNSRKGIVAPSTAKLPDYQI